MLLDAGTWLVDHFDEVLEAWAALTLLAVVVTNWTPTKKDDAFPSRMGALAQGVMNLCSFRPPSANRLQRPEDPVALREEAQG